LTQAVRIEAPNFHATKFRAGMTPSGELLSLSVRTTSKKASLGIPDHFDIIIAALKTLKQQEAEG
jgi:hypothetical protein